MEDIPEVRLLLPVVEDVLLREVHAEVGAVCVVLEQARLGQLVEGVSVASRVFLSLVRIVLRIGDFVVVDVIEN